ncbi:MAG: DUF6978 family protein [Culicoidibacterales bacterium]
MSKHDQHIYDLLYTVLKHFKEKNITMPIVGTEYFTGITNDKKFEFKIMIRISSRIPGKFEIAKFHDNERIFAIDIQGKPHKNADGTITTADHVHIFRNNELLAYSMTEFHNKFFKNNSDLFVLFCEMCEYLNIEFHSLKQISLFH